jgi:hypothetical protein
MICLNHLVAYCFVILSLESVRASAAAHDGRTRDCW